MRVCLTMLLVTILAAASAQSSMISTYYGDDDGFGVGLTSGSFGSDPASNNNDPGDAAGTDVRLIADGLFYFAPGFSPTGSFEAFSIASGEVITGAILTARFGSFDPIVPISDPNYLMLDGVEVTSFFDLFADKTSSDGDANNAIETVSIVLDTTLFAALADGDVNLTGTRISEGSGSGSFQIDFFRIDITTAPIPEPTASVLFGAGLIVVGRALRRRIA